MIFSVLLVVCCCFIANNQWFINKFIKLRGTFLGKENGELSGNSHIFKKSGNSWLNCGNPVSGNMQLSYKICIGCCFFVDHLELDWDEEWDEIYVHGKKIEKEGTAKHWVKHCFFFENAYVERRQQYGKIWWVDD